MGTINSSDRIAATLYSLGTWFVSGIYIYKMHKGDSDDDDDNNNNLLYNIQKLTTRKNVDKESSLSWLLAGCTWYCSCHL
jgi:hypothetical protein